jgi:hypothetical protein
MWISRELVDELPEPLGLFLKGQNVKLIAAAHGITPPAYSDPAIDTFCGQAARKSTC